MYLNSGDWIENLTALEYYNKQWNLYSYNDDDLEKNTLETETSIDIIDQSTEEIFGQLLADFNFKI
jgi:hypothetical protein